MNGMTLAWRVEDACQGAWPTLRQLRLGGWVLRFAGGVLSRRANSANPLGSEPAAGDDLIRGCEALYRRQRQPAIFRLPSTLAPAIDRRLAQLGYTGEGETSVLYGEIGAVAAAPDPAVRLAGRPSRQWLAAMAALQRHTPEQARAYRRTVRAVMVPAAFATLAIDGEIAALAYGALLDRLFCYESVVTAAHRRGHGYAGRVIGSLTAWAAAQGAAGVCLEVVADNRPALALYGRVGIATELYRYHYRRQPAASGL